MLRQRGQGAQRQGRPGDFWGSWRGSHSISSSHRHSVPQSHHLNPDAVDDASATRRAGAATDDTDVTATAIATFPPGSAMRMRRSTRQWSGTRCCSVT